MTKMLYRFMTFFQNNQETKQKFMLFFKELMVFRKLMVFMFTEYFPKFAPECETFLRCMYIF